MVIIPLDIRPDPDDDHAQQAWVDATADGATLRLLLDTGTYRSSLPYVEPFASRPREAVAGGRGVFGVPAGEILVEVDQLTTGEVTTRDLVLQLQPEGWQHPSLLGMDVLGSHRCDFHFTGRARIDLDADEDALWLPLATEPHRTPTVEVIWDDTSVQAIWDTGAGTTIVDRTWADRHPEIVTMRNERGHGIDVTGTGSSHPWGTMAPCEIGGIEFGEQTCGVVDFAAMNATLTSPIQVIIGLPLIVQATWWMDFPSRRYAVRR